MPHEILKDLKPRKYQEEIFEKCKDKNCLVVLPTGIGKCMEYSEPLLFSDGTTEKIGEYFEKELKKGNILKKDEEHITISPGKSKRVISLNNLLKLEKQKIIAIHKIKTNQHLLKIKTYSGAEITVTPEHPLLTLNECLEWKKADAFRTKDTIATPSRLPEPKISNKIDLIKIFTNINPNMNCYVGVKRDFAKKIKVYNECKLTELFNKGIKNKELIKNITYFKIKGGRADHTKIKKIEKFSSELLYWVALVIGEGGMYGGIRFYNEDKTLLEIFKNLSYKIFGIRTKKIKGGLKISSTALYFFIRNLFDLYSGQHSRDKTISDHIMKLNNKFVSEFISGLYDAEGSVRKDGLIEFITASKDMANKLCYLLLRFGIKPRIKEKISRAANSSNPIKRVYYRVNIEGTKDAKIFQRDINFKQKEKKKKLEIFLRKKLSYNPNFNLIPLSGGFIRNIRNSLKLSSTRWKDFDIPGIDTYERNERKFSHKTLKKVVKGFEKSSILNKRINTKIDFLKRLIKSNIYWDRIKQIEKIKSKWVYDISLEKNFNFVAGKNGGVIAHNTLIALMLSIYTQKKYPATKTLFLAPTRPLAEQHLAYFKKHLPELFAELTLFTGKVDAEKRKQLWQNSDIIFSTPQCIGNDLKNNLYDLEDVTLLIEDECHRCLKNYSYTYVAEKYKQQSRIPKVLGLTASPGTTKEIIKQIAKNLGIESIEIRTRESEDVKEYLQELEFEIIKIEFPKEFREITDIIRALYAKKAEELKNRKLIFGPINKITLLKAQSNIMSSITKGNKNFNMFSGASACAQALKFSHLIELLETQTLYTAQNYIKSMFEQAAQKKSRAVQQIIKNSEFNKAYVKLNELVSKNIEHPKLLELKNLIEDSIKENPKNKTIIFSQYRDTITQIYRTLSEIPNINAKIFVGQAKKTTGDSSTGLSQKEQQKIMEEFREGKINVIISSSIGEEGLDIPEVNSVIFYEPIPSAIRKIQRMGRTARLMKGKTIILLTEGTLDEIFHYASKAKEKRMYSSLNAIKKDLDNGISLNEPEFNEAEKNKDNKKITEEKDKSGEQKRLF